MDEHPRLYPLRRVIVGVYRKGEIVLRELIDINRYLHDFTSALWLIGCLLLWMLWRESRRSGIAAETTVVLARLAAHLRVLTLPALLVALGSGGIRAATFARYEHVGEITDATIGILVAKHIAFAVLVAWGIWVHWKSRAMASPVVDRH